MCNVTEILQPTKVVRKVITREGIALDIRLVDEHDKAALTALFEQVSDEDRCAGSIREAGIALLGLRAGLVENGLGHDPRPLSSAALLCDCDRPAFGDGMC